MLDTVHALAPATGALGDAQTGRAEEAAFVAVAVDWLGGDIGLGKENKLSQRFE